MASAKQKTNRSPIVFISSTAEDLKEYRAAARDAALATGFQPVMQEYFEASGNRPFRECMEKVDSADLVVAIVAHRYGWIPPDQPEPAGPAEKKSITWLECERAKDLLVFLVDESGPWPEDRREDYKLTSAMRNGRADPAMFAEVNERLRKLEAFKAWLHQHTTRATFSNPDDLRAKISESFLAWLKKHPEFLAVDQAIPEDPGKYLRALLAANSFIDIRGLQVGSGKAHRFPIEELFITLTTTLEAEPVTQKSGAPKEGRPAGRSAGSSGTGPWTRLRSWFSTVTAAADPLSILRAGLERIARQSVPLQAALAHPRLVIIGDPGSGKTTFLKRAVFELSHGLVEGDGEGQPFPILIRLPEFQEFIEASRRSSPQSKQTAIDRPVWLSRFLAHNSEESNWGLSQDFFQRQLENGPCMILFDGLDEAPDLASREGLSRLVERIAETYENCSVAVTTRPAAYVDKVVLPGFTHARIDPLDDDAIQLFLTRWCESLYANDPAEARRHAGELLDALARRPEIRRMATNPVMLTALAVLHWNEKRLPEQRADLYESIIRWLSRSRAPKSGRPAAERAVVLIQELALAMQNHKDGRQTQVSRRWAAEAIAVEWNEPNTAEAIRQAEQFLDAEELDSGIVVRRGTDIAFWHLTFQEFLAARAIASRTDADQRELLFRPRDKIYRPEWREVMLLFAGILHQSGRPKMDAFVSDVLELLGAKPSLADQARAAGLFGAILRDLDPVQYEIRDSRYGELLDRVLVIFDARRARSVPVETRIEAAEALGKAGDPRLDPDHPERWVEIPEGTFLMGAQDEDPRKPNYDAEAYFWESPVHEVRLDHFAISRFPVTVSEFQRFIEDNGYQREALWKAGGFGQFQAPRDWLTQTQFPNRPVVGVSWFEAAAYVEWSGCRLPSEAEWERAARGTTGRRYPWGNEPADLSRLNCLESHLGRPTPVGIYPDGATPDGIFDLAGNAFEWCSDWFESYSVASPNPEGPAKRRSHVFRGGASGLVATFARASFRTGLEPPEHLIGFRVVRVRTS